AEESADVGRGPADPSRDPAREGEHFRRDGRFAAGGPEVRIVVNGIREAALVEEVEEGGAELGAARRAETERIGEAGNARDAIVLATRRKVDEVPGLGDEGPAADPPATAA